MTPPPASRASSGWHQYAEGEACPKCGRAALEREMVDVGVCVIPGPWRCLDCDWQEPAPDQLIVVDDSEDSLW